MRYLIPIILLPALFFIAGAVNQSDEYQIELHPPEFKVETVKYVLSDVPVKFVKISKITLDGKLDKNFNQQVEIKGLRWSKREKIDDLQFRVREDIELPPFKNGILELKSNAEAGTKVFIVDSEIVVDPTAPNPLVQQVTFIYRWFAILPPLLAIVLAIWLKDVIMALILAVFSGVLIIFRGDILQAFTSTLIDFVVAVIAEADPDSGEHTHLLIILFTMFLGAMIGVMAKSRGTEAIVRSMARFTTTRERGQLVTWLMGFVVFFDDYANTFLVGGTMRPVTDRLKISREKLAFLVDSTAAPVAGLALISTWVGFEVGVIDGAYQSIFGPTGTEYSAYNTFLMTIPYRFYPLLLLGFVGLIAYSGHDFGPMLKAEIRAIAEGHVIRPDATVSVPEETVQDEESDTIVPRMRNAIVPLAVLLISIIVGLYFSGSQSIDRKNFENAAKIKAGTAKLIEKDLAGILGQNTSSGVLLYSSFLASITAIFIATISRALSLKKSLEAWANGCRGMFIALMVLVLAWSIAKVCDPDHLNTAGFLVETTAGKLDTVWMPALAFVLSAVVSFATGSSWATMGLLIPLFSSMTYYMLLEQNDAANPNHSILVSTIGAILAGAIFGDHCSPISDTTVLSSAASGSDHLDHVATQLPYALTVGAVALIFGYIPAGFGYPFYVLLPLGMIVLYIIVMFLGRSAEEESKKLIGEVEPVADKKEESEDSEDSIDEEK